MATNIAKSFGYEVLELNASDTRSKKSVSEQLQDVVTSNSIGNNMKTFNKRLIIMDEGIIYNLDYYFVLNINIVDGMGGSDRGGISELIQIMKKSKNPIICICNDRQSPKIRSLANHCYDLRVKRPTKTQIANRMIAIGHAEGLIIDVNAAELLVEQSGNDIRQVIHSIQMWRASALSMNYSDLKGNLNRIEKDKVLRQSPFDACMTILSGSRNNNSLDDRYNSFFIGTFEL